MPVFTAIVAAVTTFVAGLTWASVGSFIVRTLVLVGINQLATRMLAPKNSKLTDKGIRLQLEPATDNSLPVVYGSAYLGGAITDAYMTNDNKTMWYCVAISEKTGTVYSTNTDSEYSIGEIYWGNNRVTFKSDGVTVDYVTDTTGGIDRNPSGLVRIYLYKNGGNAPTLPTVGVPGSPSLPGAAYTVWGGGGVWTADHRMDGCVFALIRVDYNQEKSVVGLQAMQFQVQNTMKDPGDVFYDYVTNQRYGAGLAVSDVDLTSVSELTTYSQQSVTYNTTETLPDRYQINGVIRTTEPVLSNLERITSAAGSWLTYDIGSGKWGVVINKARGAQVDQTFDDQHILGEITLSGTALDSLYNSVEVRFPHRDLRDQADFRVISTPDEDRNPNEPDNRLTLDIDLCNEPVQAQILATLELDANRLESVVTFNTDYSKIQTEAGDIIAIYNDAYGWNTEGGFADGKDFRVLRVVETEDEEGRLVVQITAKEYFDVYNPGALTRPPVNANVGIIGTGVLAAPTAPTFTVYNNVKTPRIDLETVVPTGNYAAVTVVDFYATSDANVTPDSDRNYFFLGSTNTRVVGGNTGVITGNIGIPIPQGSTVRLEGVVLPQDQYYFKARVGNDRGRSDFSSPSTLLDWIPVQITDGNDSGNTGIRIPVVDGNGNTVTSTVDIYNFIYSVVGCGDIDFGDFEGGCGIPGIGDGGISIRLPTPVNGANVTYPDHKLAVLRVPNLVNKSKFSEDSGYFYQVSSNNSVDFWNYSSANPYDTVPVGYTPYYPFGGAYDSSSEKAVTVGGRYSLANETLYWGTGANAATYYGNIDGGSITTWIRPKYGLPGGKALNSKTDVSQVMYGVANNDANLWVAVGANGAIYTSNNVNTINSAQQNATWTLRTSGTTEPLYDVAYGGNVWVAVGGNGVVLTSNNATTWTSKTSGVTKDLFCVATDTANTWVAAGWQSRVRSTDNGNTWAQTPVQPSGTYGDIAYGGNTWVLVGGTAYAKTYANVQTTKTLRPDIQSGAVVVFSTDGGNAWTNYSFGNATPKEALTVTYSPTYQRFYMGCQHRQWGWIHSGATDQDIFGNVYTTYEFTTPLTVGSLYYSGVNNGNSWTRMPATTLGEWQEAAAYSLIFPLE